MAYALQRRFGSTKATYDRLNADWPAAYETSLMDVTRIALSHATATARGATVLRGEFGTGTRQDPRWADALVEKCEGGEGMTDLLAAIDDAIQRREIAPAADQNRAVPVRFRLRRTARR